MSLATVKQKNSLKAFSSEAILIRDIVAEIKTIPNFIELKHNVELIEHVLQILINSIPSKVKIDIKQTGVKIMVGIFPYDANELKVLEKHIEYLVDNNIIKKISTLSNIYKGSKWFLKKKVLGV